MEFRDPCVKFVNGPVVESESRNRMYEAFFYSQFVCFCASKAIPGHVPVDWFVLCYSKIAKDRRIGKGRINVQQRPIETDVANVYSTLWRSDCLEKWRVSIVDQIRHTEDASKIGKKCEFTRGCHEKSISQKSKSHRLWRARLRKVDNAGLLPIAEPTTSLTIQQITAHNAVKQS